MVIYGLFPDSDAVSELSPAPSVPDSFVRTFLVGAAASWLSLFVLAWFSLAWVSVVSFVGCILVLAVRDKILRKRYVEAWVALFDGRSDAFATTARIMHGDELREFLVSHDGQSVCRGCGVDFFDFVCNSSGDLVGTRRVIRYGRGVRIEYIFLATYGTVGGCRVVFPVFVRSRKVSFDFDMRCFRDPDSVSLDVWYVEGDSGVICFLHGDVYEELDVKSTGFTWVCQ